MTAATVAVTGATGALGGGIARRLAERGIAQRLIVRDAARAPALPRAEVAVASYADRAALVSALQGIETAFFVSGFEAADRLAQHKAAVAAFAEAGVGRVVYTSFLRAAADSTFTFARDHFETEAAMEAAGLPFVALRNSLYMDILPHFAVEGVIRGPAAEGRFAPVARDDVAAVAVAALLDPDRSTQRWEVTGPALMTMSEVAATLSEAGGEPVRFVDETLEEAYASRASAEATQFELDGWVTSYRAIAVGDLELVSDTVERVTGRPAQSFEAFLAA